MARFAAVLVAGTIGLTLVAGSTAATSSATSTIDLSTPTAIDNYLLSKGVDPSTVVRQTGLFNYAGPNCPGVGWTCTTATQVVQIAAPGGQNVDECQGGSFVTAGVCVIVQTTADRNTAKCIEHSGTDQHCMITQGGAVRNFARVDQLISESDGSTQDAIQTADVTQSKASQLNELQLDQDINQSTNSGSPQSQNAHQAVLLDQSATGNGNNFAHAHQSQDQNETGPATAQDQNTGPLPSGLANGQSVITDCATAASTASNGKVTTPNACGAFTQSADSGDNEAHLHQFGNESERSTASTATQTQGLFSNGLGGSFELASNTGNSRGHAVQHKQESASSNGGTQHQFDPIGCCGISVTGSGQENIDEASNQSAAGGTFTQSADLVGTSHVTGGSCFVSQHANQNAAATAVNDSNTTPPCLLNDETNCNSGNVEVTFGNCTTTTTPPPSPGLLSVLAGTPTLGQPLTPLNVTAEPSSYTLPSWYVPF